ncbi:hypothetical protein L873DRAFT_1846752 [Choiromyces venosus 120613-1]|uniref:Transcription initiation factor IIA subunit 2 n=1 Tax=Choiromyces venosus 120613-1 TaxID=1336337 RepID=A0A3N4J7F2_9PEZI|nr:hypothetical protein L873DRAFT_1846752 [Choiromyces venosus 120613-1]
MKYMKDGNPIIWDIYRRASVCVALLDVLDALVNTGKITQSLARRILYNYDVSVQDNIGKCGVEIKMKAKIIDYKFVESVWWFNLKDVIISEGPIRRRTGKEIIRFPGPLRVVAVGYDATAKTVSTRIPGRHQTYKSERV